MYSWKFSTEKERWPYWYLIAFAVVIWLSIWGVLNKIYIFSFLIFLISWVYLYLENSTNSDVFIEIKDEWVYINSVLYEFEKMSSFGFVFRDSEPIILRFFLKWKWLKNLDIDIDKEIYEQIDWPLSSVLEKKSELKESNLEKFINFINL